MTPTQLCFSTTGQKKKKKPSIADPLRELSTGITSL